MGRLERLALAAGAAAHLALTGAAGAAPEVSLRGTASLGFDSNARRVFNSTILDADAVGSALVAGSGRVPLGPLELSGWYQAAGRKFLRYSSQDTLAQEASVEVAARPLSTVQLALDGRGKDRHGSPWQYSELQGALALRWRALPELEVELRGGGHRFIYWTQIDYSYSATEATGTASFRLDRHHAISATGYLGHRRYNAYAYVPPSVPDPPQDQREDGVLSAGAAYTYRGAYQLSAGYQYFDEDSNSYRETVRVHRLTLTLGTPLPLEWTLLTQLVLQLADYPEGIPTSLGQGLEEDEERHNALSIKLLRPVGERVDLELRYGLYINALPQYGFYMRQVASVG
ncbi:MAG TPA: hypothetical protein VND93_14635, partial [Myxococcales bacterium]|nr:hypothetical protein [Myxococcales bacterium]